MTIPTYQEMVEYCQKTTPHWELPQAIYTNMKWVVLAEQTETHKLIQTLLQIIHEDKLCKCECKSCELIRSAIREVTI